METVGERVGVRLIMLLTVLPSLPTLSPLAGAVSDDVTGPPAPEPMYCQDRSGRLEPDEFQGRSCSMCYHYLFQHGRLVPLPPLYEQLIPRPGVNVTGSDAAYAGPITPDPTNATAVGLVCGTLASQEDCRRWKACCLAAHHCCDRQLAAPPLRHPGGAALAGGHPQQSAATPYCPRTWDGYSCWGDTPAGVTVDASCPDFLDPALAWPRRTGTAVKRCQLNGTWFTKGGLQWTDYTKCIDKDSYLVGVYICLACYSLSLIFLLPSIVIFCVFRELLRQHRIRLHINFFVSLGLTSVACVCWYQLVHYDLLANPAHLETVLYTNPVWCRVLSFFKIYLTSTNYFWMFIEGYYLHRLISRAFEPPKTLIPLYLIGWGAPLLPSIAYSIVRAMKGNTECWAKNLGAIDWIIYAPNMACLVVNLVFLCNILRILLFQLHSHPHEPSNFRRALKAVFMLMPLFGLQLFLTIYRPPQESAGSQAYEYINLIINGSQGIFVSCIFCFLNGEVLAQCQRRCRCCVCLGARQRAQSQSNQMTQVTTADDRRSMSESNDSLPAKHNGRLSAEGCGGADLDPKGDSMGAGASARPSQGGQASSTRGGYTAVPTLPAQDTTPV